VDRTHGLARISGRLARAGNEVHGHLRLAPPLLFHERMLSLELVYQYRKLAGKCEAGLGLDVDEILELTALEAAMAPAPADRGGDPRSGRARADFSCRLRGAHGLNDRVRVTELGPGGLVCRQTPYVEEGATVEVVVDVPDRDVSYRFYAKVAWLREDVGDDFALGLDLVGAPLLLHHGRTEHVEDAVDRIAELQAA
jgi:hypothetical protein